MKYLIKKLFNNNNMLMKKTNKLLIMIYYKNKTNILNKIIYSEVFIKILLKNYKMVYLL